MAEDIIKSLTTLPSGDTNYESSLNKASVAQLKYAIQLMRLSVKGKNASRIKACEARLKKLESGETSPAKETSKSTKTSAKKEEKELKITPLDKTKKPKIIPYENVKGNATYEQCEAKLNKAKEIFTDNDTAYVIEGVLERCKVDETFRNNVMREDKSYEGFFKYMYDIARSGYCIKVGEIGGIIEPNTAIELAFDYFSGEPVKEPKKATESVTKASPKTEKASAPKKTTATNKITTKKAEPKKETSGIFNFGIANDGQMTFGF